MKAQIGHVYEKDGQRKLVIRCGGPDDAPLMVAWLFADDENVTIGSLDGQSAEDLGNELAGWTDMGLMPDPDEAADRSEP